MSIGVILLCKDNVNEFRTNVLLEIMGRTVLSYVVERVKTSIPDASLAVAINRNSDRSNVGQYCHRTGLEIVGWNNHRMYLDSLNYAKNSGWDYVVLVDGASLFVDIDALKAMSAIISTDEFDLVTNLPSETFPRSMGIEVLRKSSINSIIAKAENINEFKDLSAYFISQCGLYKCFEYKNITCPDAASLELSLDSSAGLKNIECVIRGSGYAPARLGLKDILNCLSVNSRKFPWKGSSGPLLIAEVGGNHEGDFEVAKAMTESAIASGADCVKFQLYSGDTLVSPVESPDRHRHFQKFELTQEQHIQLAEMCRESGVVYLASVWDLEMLEWIDAYLDFYKIGSGDMTAWPIIKEFARREKPILLSIGLSTMEEVLQTISFIQRVNTRYFEPGMLCILQCTSMYPIPDEDANLCVMNTLRALTNLSVGYSDHTVGIEALKVAAAMGADVLEFHFTDNREGKTFRDHKVSLVLDEVIQLKKDIEKITTLRGDGIKVPQSSELDNEHNVSFRRGVYLSREVKEGDLIQADDLVFLRPAHGVDARDVDLLVGSRALRDLVPFKAIKYGVDCLLQSAD